MTTVTAPPSADAADPVEAHAALVARIRAGDRAAAAVVVRAHTAAMLAEIVPIVGDVARAEPVLVTVCRKILAHIADVPADISAEVLGAWAVRVARCTAKGWVRARRPNAPRAAGSADGRR